MPRDRNRVFRAPDELWSAARATAHGRGETLSTVIRRALTAYVKRHGKKD